MGKDGRRPVKIREEHVAYPSHAVDMRHPIVLEEEGRPVVVILPYAAYQRLAARPEQTRVDWRTRFRQLLAEVHAQTLSFSPEEIGSDITATFEEMRQERYGHAGSD